LSRHPSVLRKPSRLPELPERGARPRTPRRNGARAQPHERPASLVPASSPCPPGKSAAGLLRLERLGRPVPRRPGHLPGLRVVELVVRSRGRAVLLAPLLLPPARPELREPRGPPGDAPDHRLLAGDGGRRHPTR